MSKHKEVDQIAEFIVDMAKGVRWIGVGLLGMVGLYLAAIYATLAYQFLINKLDYLAVLGVWIVFQCAVAYLIWDGK